MKAPPPPARPRLSPRERQVGALICCAYSDKEVASALRLSVWTARGYARSLAGKLGARNRVATAIAFADVMRTAQKG